jgi:hypothetical protein
MKGAAIAATISMMTPIATQAELKKSFSVMIFTPGLCACISHPKILVQHPSPMTSKKTSAQLRHSYK